MLTDFAPKETRFKASLKNGRNVELTLRPFTLGDMAWAQNMFPTEADQLAIASMKIEPIARMIWHQMAPESKQIFMKFKFQKEDENGNLIEGYEPEGYERLIEAMTGLDDFMAGFNALTLCRGVNGFIDDGVKKKTVRRTRTTGSKSMTFLHRLMGIRPRNS